MARASRFGRWLFLLVGLCAAAPLLLADGSQFGTLSGRIKDQSGAALPGVTVELVSADQGFRRSVTSDSSGSFNFALLPPGRYTVKAALASFESFESDNNVVASEKTTTVAVMLKLAATAETVTVSGDVPLVDKTNVSDTTRVDSSLAESIAITRQYQSVVEMAPGLNDADADGNTNSHGAVDTSNLFLFDGVDITDPTTGTFGANQNFDTIQEVVVSNSALSAEYGRAQGAVINVISKSGTNELHGSARALVTNDNWNAQNKGASPQGTSFQRTKLDKDVYDYLFTLGGPVWKDHIWFFGGYQRNPQFTPPAQTQVSTVPENAPFTGQSYSQTRTFVAWQGKLNAQITPSHAVVFNAQADPFTGIVNDYWGASADLRALTGQDQSNDCPWACIWQARYTGVFGSQLSAEASYAQQRGGLTVNSYLGQGSPYFNFADQLYYNGATFNGFVERPRDQANVALNMYTQIFGHSHQFKVGVDYQSIKSEAAFTYANNELFLVSGFNPQTHEPELQVGDLWFKGVSALPSVSTGKIYGIYGLDKFDATDRLSFNLGVRVDIQDGKSDLRQSVVSATTVSPRLSGTYDIFGNGKTLASVAYGQYRDFLVQNIIDSIFSGVPQLTNYDVYAWDGSQFDFSYPIRGGAGGSPVNTSLKPSRVDEFNIALQQQIGNTMAVGIRGIYRKWNDLIDDSKILTDDGTKILTPANFSNDALKRQYKAIELTAEKRFGKNWQALASYTLSRASGNHEATFASQLFDYAGDTCNVGKVGDIEPAISGPCPQILANNRNGLLSYDVTHAFKFFAAYTLPLSFVNLTAAPSFVFLSGLPYQETRNFTINGDTDTYYYTKKGSSRLPNWYTLNFALEADLKPFGPLQVGVKGEIANLTNQQPVVDTTRITLLPGANFGQPTSRNALATPRNYQFSAVLKF